MSSPFSKSVSARSQDLALQPKARAHATTATARAPGNTPIIAHDYFAIRGGGERLVLSLAKALHADVMYGYKTAESYDDAAFPDRSIDLGLPAPLRRAGLRAAALAMQFWTARNRLANHSTRIYSGVAAPFAAPARGNGKNILYCHTPPRFIYDQKHHFAKRVGNDPVRRLVLNQFQRGYEAAIERMDVIIANSVTVHEPRLEIADDGADDKAPKLPNTME